MAVLCVSRQFGSDGEALSKAVAQALGYEYLDKDRILEGMRHAGEQWVRLSQESDETCPTLWERYDWGYRGLVALVEAQIYEFAARDAAVIVGRGGHVLLKGIPHVLSVRFEAPEAARVARVMRRDNLDQATAEWLIQKMDHERACYVQANYGKQWDEAKHYDRVVDTEAESRESILETLTEDLQERDQGATEEGRVQLHQMALAATVKAKIATDTRVFIPTLEVVHEGGVLVLRGVVRSQKESGIADEIAREASPRTPVLNRLHLRTAV